MKSKARTKKDRKSNKVKEPAKPVIDSREDDRTYGGMDLGNFKKNMGCGG